jgi:hypothetical protein
MKVIFGLGSNTEGGSLQGRHGYLMPEGYINGWMKEMAQPVTFREESLVELRFAKNKYSLHELPLDKQPAILDRLRLIDQDAATRLAAGETVLRQVGSPAVLAIFEVGIAPWRFQLSYPYGSVDDFLAYRPDKAAASPVEVPCFAKILLDHPHAEPIYLRQDGDRWVFTDDYDSCLISRFVESLYQDELQHPGQYRNLIRRCREAVQGANILPGATKVRVDPMASLPYAWQKEWAEEIAKALDIQEATEMTLSTLQERLGYERWRALFSVGQYVVQILEPVSNINLECRVPKPMFKPVKPTAGMEILYGEERYRLEMPAGTRRGWIVTRLSDSQRLRMSAKELASILRNEAVRKHKIEMQNYQEALLARKTLTKPMEQVTLF